MLIVLLVLLMTTATATFAVHSTAIEIRSAGYNRQALQAQYVAEGGLTSALEYIDTQDAQATFIQYSRTQVAANTQSAPGEATIDRETNLVRVEMDDFDGAPGVLSPPLETDTARTPSLGPHSLYVPTFRVDGTDLHRTTQSVAGREMSGRSSMMYVRMTLTSRGRMAPPGDFRATGDDRDFNEIAVNARALSQMGPFSLGGGG